MIKNTKRLQQFEKEFVQKNSLSHLQALKLLDGMWLDRPPKRSEDTVGIGVLAACV